MADALTDLLRDAYIAGVDDLGFDNWYRGRFPMPTDSCDVTHLAGQGSRDEAGRFCGMIDATGQMAAAPAGKVGYCGPNCDHCKDFRVYALNDSDGVWVCHPDSDAMDPRS